MKNLIKNITLAILVTSIAVSATYGKTKSMTSNEFSIRFQKMDTKLLGTWEKNEYQDRTKMKYCQFNANGTFIAFERDNGTYRITGKGSWKVEGASIFIYHGAEKSTPVKYEQQNNMLIFGDNITYIKPSVLYANK